MNGKRILCLLLAVLMAAALVSCAKPGGDTSTEPPATDAPASDPDTTAAPVSDATEGSTAAPAAASVPGTLIALNAGDGAPVITGLRLSGNRSGSEAFNARELAAEGIRCIFELDEWVEVTPETAADELTLWVLLHNADQTAYEKMAFSEETPGLMGYCELARPEEGDAWGSFYLNPDDAPPEYYDLVFTVDGRAVASIVTHFYAQDVLSALPDEELAKLTDDWTA